MRHEKISAKDRCQDANIDILSLKTQHFQSAPSTPDIPSSVGVMIVASYIMLLGSFAVTMVGSRSTALALSICFFFLGMYLLIPAIFLRIESRQLRRPSLSSFMEIGMQTYAGHMSGKDALAQILVVPVLLTGAAIVMGIMAIKVL